MAGGARAVGAPSWASVSCSLPPSLARSGTPSDHRDKPSWADHHFFFFCFCDDLGPRGRKHPVSRDRLRGLFRRQVRSELRFTKSWSPAFSPTMDSHYILESWSNADRRHPLPRFVHHRCPANQSLFSARADKARLHLTCLFGSGRVATVMFMVPQVQQPGLKGALCESQRRPGPA